MENLKELEEQWNLEQEGGELERATSVTVRGVLNMLKESIGGESKSEAVLPLGNGDPSHFPSFRAAISAEDAIVDALRSANFNSYSPTGGLVSARRAVAEYMSRDVPHRLSEDDVYLTVGCTQAIEIVIRSISRQGANILLPRPGFPYYESFAACTNLQVRHFNLLPEQGWEVDLDSVEALSDHNTVAIVVINPGNPCGNVYKRQHLEKVAEKARKLRMVVISDEVYEGLTYGSVEFVSMAVFGAIVPVITLGSLSKRWCAPGWRLGWIVTHDPNRIFIKTGLTKKIMGCLNITSDPPTFIQGALPDILKKTNADYFSKIVGLLKETAETCYNTMKEIPCITCPNKPQGSMFVMVKLNTSLLDDISDDMDFCLKLIKEESVIILPGVALGMKNWVRITFAVEPPILEDGLKRIKSFCERHSKRQLSISLQSP